jgi:DNA-binding NarL/FixJ family response regulator
MSRTGTSVVVVDQEEIFRTGLCAILGGLDLVVVAGVASDTAEALRLARAKQPQVVLLDGSLEPTGPGSLVRELRRISPVSAVIVLSADPAPADVLTCVAAGASGYLLKSAPAIELAEAIKRAVTGEAFIDSRLAGRLVQALSERSDAAAITRQPEPLTPREREVLAEISHGRSNKEIATDLSMASGTVKIHVERILRKLSAANRVEAATIGLHYGLIPSDDILTASGSTASEG